MREAEKAMATIPKVYTVSLECATAEARGKTVQALKIPRVAPERVAVRDPETGRVYLVDADDLIEPS